jgi:hypothetical protein
MVQRTNILFRYLAVIALIAFAGKATAQAPAPSAPQYYNVLGLGSSEGDSTFWYPYPMVVLELKDTAKHVVRVRFTNLGILGNDEETIIQPTHVIDSMTVGYRANTPLLHFSVPVTPYLVFIETIDRTTGKVIEIRPFPYRMNVERFASTRVDRIHEPQAALINPLLRREFKPSMLPLTLETNPGWRVREQFDTSGTYSLTYLDPETSAIKLTLTMRSASVQEIDSASWANFKEQARQTFGDRGIPTNSVGDFLVDDPSTRRIIRAGYELLAKREDGGMDYIAAYLTPKSIILMMAPLTEPAPSAEYDYFRSIARSFKLK